MNTNPSNQEGRIMICIDEYLKSEEQEQILEELTKEWKNDFGEPWTEKLSINFSDSEREEKLERHSEILRAYEKWNEESGKFFMCEAKETQKING